MGTQNSAQKKIVWFRERFELMNQRNIILNQKKLLAQFCLDNASTERKGKELLKIFETAGEIRLFGGEIGTPEQIKEETGQSPEIQEIID